MINHEGMERLRRRMLRVYENNLPQPVTTPENTPQEPVDPFIDAIRSFSRGNGGD